jgi:peptide-methionine (R)-S-oxide reductase
MKETPMLTWKDVIHFAVNGNPVPDSRVEKTEADWKSILSPSQFRITRQKGTESPHSGALCTSYDAGKYACVCCETPLFDSTIKFESGTGWPSFTQPIKENAIKYTCDAHLGHVFPDGPEPSGLRYCINSESMVLLKTEDAHE